MIPVDNLKWIAWFDVTGMQKRGHDLSRKRLFRIEAALDARAIDNENHPIIAVAKSMRVTAGIPLYFSLIGAAELIEPLRVEFEIRAAIDGYAVLDFPAGFIAGVERRDY